MTALDVSPTDGQESENVTTDVVTIGVDEGTFEVETGDMSASGSVIERPDSGKKKKTTRRRKRTGGQKPQQLTEKQMEAVKLHGECEGNIAEVGRRMGIDRKSADQHIKAGFGKLGKEVPQTSTTQRLKRGKRGEDDVSEEDDKRR